MRTYISFEHSLSLKGYCAQLSTATLHANFASTAHLSTSVQLHTEHYISASKRSRLDARRWYRTLVSVSARFALLRQCEGRSMFQNRKKSRSRIEAFDILVKRLGRIHFL